MSERASARARSPWLMVCASAAAAGLALAAALWQTRARSPEAGHAASHMTVTPERAAESFIRAYDSGDLSLATVLATGELAQQLQAGHVPLAAGAAHGRDAARVDRAFVVQESHRLDANRLRLVGVLVQEGEDERFGSPVSLTLRRQAARYLVEDIQW